MLLTTPSGKTYALFQSQVQSGSQSVDKLRAAIKGSAKLEAQLGREMQLVREVATQKAGLFHIPPNYVVALLSRSAKAA